MARTLVAATTLVMTTVMGLQSALAREDDGTIDEVALVAAETGTDVVQLRGAAGTVGVSARRYLEGEGVLTPPIQHASQAVAPAQPPGAAVSARIECIVRYESGGNPNAYNRSSGASGLLQF